MSKNYQKGQYNKTGKSRGNRNHREDRYHEESSDFEGFRNPYFQPQPQLNHNMNWPQSPYHMMPPIQPGYYPGYQPMTTTIISTQPTLYGYQSSSTIVHQTNLSPSRIINPPVKPSP